MFTYVLENVQVGFDERPDGGGVLAFFDPPSQQQVQIPMNAKQRKAMEMLLAGKNIVTATELPQ